MTPSYNPVAGGVQRIVEKLGNYFAIQGKDVYYYSMSNNGHIDPKCGELIHSDQQGGQSNECNLIKLSDTIRRIKPDVVLNEMPYEKSLRRVLSEGKLSYNYLLLACLNNSLFSVKNNLSHYAKSTGPKVIGRLLDNFIGHSILLYLHKLKHARDLKSILDKHDFFVFPTASQAGMDELGYFIGSYEQDKIYGIPNSIPDVGKMDLVVKEKIILYVGRLNITQKRADLLLDFWKKAYPKLPDWRFEIVGDGHFKKEMQRMIDDESIPGVSLRGYQVPDEYYSRASIFVMPSAYEGFPSVLLEAQANGVVPVLFNNYPALSWIVNDNKDAILIPSFDVKKMAEAVIEIANENTKWRKLAEASLINANRFTIDKVGSMWLKMFSNQESLCDRN